MDRTIIGLDNGLFPVQHQVIIWTYASVVNTGEYSGQVGSEQSHLMETTDQWPLTGRASPVSPSKCLEWKDPSSVFQLLSPGKVPKNPLETRLEATPG